MKPDGRPVGGRDIVDAEILHADPVVEPGSHAEQHAGGVGRFRENRVDGVTEDGLEAEGDATGTATHPTRQVHEERVFLVHRDVEGLELARQTPPGHRVTEEQRRGVLVIDEVHRRIGSGLFAASGHRRRIVGLVLRHLDAVPAEHLLLPRAGVGGHVHGDVETEPRAHDPDRQAQVPGGTDRYRVLGEQLAGFR